MRADEVMSSPVVCARPTTTVQYAAAVLSERGFTLLPVVDGQGRLVGVVSEADILRRDTGGPGQPVTEVMTSPVFVVPPEAELAAVSDQLLRRGLRAVPVVAADGAVVGIVSRRDLLRTLLHAPDRLAQQVRYRLADYWGGDRQWEVHADDGVVTVTGEFRDEAERGTVRALVHVVPGVREVRLRARNGDNVPR